jgi:hypothetical protein
MEGFGKLKDSELERRKNELLKLISDSQQSLDAVVAEKRRRTKSLSLTNRQAEINRLQEELNKELK